MHYTSKACSRKKKTLPLSTIQLLRQNSWFWFVRKRVQLLMHSCQTIVRHVSSYIFRFFLIKDACCFFFKKNSSRSVRYSDLFLFLWILHKGSNACRSLYGPEYHRINSWSTIITIDGPWRYNMITETNQIAWMIFRKKKLSPSSSAICDRDLLAYNQFSCKIIGSLAGGPPAFNAAIDRIGSAVYCFFFATAPGGWFMVVSTSLGNFYESKLCGCKF